MTLHVDTASRLPIYQQLAQQIREAIARGELRPEAGLPSVRLHDLRHTAASLLVAQGVPARVVMEILGHSQIALTMNTYSHVAPEVSREAADRMAQMLWQDANEAQADDEGPAEDEDQADDEDSAQGDGR